MPAIIDADDCDEFPWADDVTGGNYLRARDVARERVDLLALVKRYAGVRSLSAVDDGVSYKAACFLPSRVPGFSGTCAQQDAATGQSGEALSITRATDGSHWRWRCFSCGRGQTRDGSRPGDVVDLVTHAEGFHVNEGNTGSLKALRHALRLVGMDHVLDGLASPRQRDAGDDIDFSLVAAPSTEVARKVVVPLSVALDLNKRAREHWQQALASNDGEAARTYLATRGVTPEQIERYAIGFARDRFDNLAPTISTQQHAAAQALGLIKLASSGRMIDVQRNRIVFPYCYPRRNNGARPTGAYGFAGRNLTGVDPHTGRDIHDFAHHDGRPPPKWLNSRNAEGVYSKSADLVGVWQALARIREHGRAVFCEGAFDMLAFDRIDAPALALVSKEFTPGHAALARDLGVRDGVYACDGDVGRKAVPKYLGSMLAAGYRLETLHVIDSDDGDDPATTEPDMLRLRWEQPIPGFDFVRSRLASGVLIRDDLRPLLSAAPWLAFDLGLAERTADTTATLPSASGFADAIVVRALAETPALAQHLAATEAAELLAAAPDWPRVRDFAFADASGPGSDPEALPRDVRRAWLRLRVQHLRDALRQHEAATPTSATDRAAILAYYERGEQLRRAKGAAEKQLTRTLALYG